MSDAGDDVSRDGTERLNERLGGKGVPIEPTDDDCPHCPDGELVKPRSEVKQCPGCLFVNNPMQGRLLLRAFGYEFHGTAGDIENRLRRFCNELGVERDELNDLLADLRGYETGGETMSEGGNDLTGSEVVCISGHVHDVDDLDKVGEQHFCPECFGAVEGSQVLAARRGQNEINERYLQPDTGHSGGESDD
jgi:hypothetical protein